MIDFQLSPPRILSHRKIWQWNFVRLAHNGVNLLQQLQLHVGVLLEEQQHEEEADGQRVWRCDHHLQHTLPHVLRRQIAVTLESHRRNGEDSAAAEEAPTFTLAGRRNRSTGE